MTSWTNCGRVSVRALHNFERLCTDRMHRPDQPAPTVRTLLRDVWRYGLALMIDAVRDLVRIPLAIAKALLSLLLASARPARRALVLLLVDTAREMVLIPVTLAAAALDVLLARMQPPYYFYRVRWLSRYSERVAHRWVMRFGVREDQRSVDPLAPDA